MPPRTVLVASANEVKMAEPWSQLIAEELVHLEMPKETAMES